MTAKHPAAFINAIAEEGTKEEAVQYLQQTWDELCDVRAALAQEREQCAKVAESLAWSNANTHMLGPEQNCLRVAAAIRARGQ